jgi:hypothetical protein
VIPENSLLVVRIYQKYGVVPKAGFEHKINGHIAIMSLFVFSIPFLYLSIFIYFSGIKKILGSSSKQVGEDKALLRFSSCVEHMEGMHKFLEGTVVVC